MTLLPRIDETACCAHGDCAAIAPGVFTVEEVATVTGTAPDELLIEAARACPAAAIELLDAGTGEPVDV